MIRQQGKRNGTASGIEMSVTNESKKQPTEDIEVCV